MSNYRTAYRRPVRLLTPRQRRRFLRKTRRDDRNAPCGFTHAQHLAAWRSWRDDCLDPDTGCGFAMQDTDQCQRGHPDDGVTSCGACGHHTDQTVGATR